MPNQDKNRQARRQRMLAREQGLENTTQVPGTSGHIALQTPKKVRRDAKSPQPPASPAEAKLRSVTEMLARRNRRRHTALLVVVLAIALAFAVLTGAFSASLAMLGDAADGVTLYLGRGTASWPVNTGIADPLQVEPLGGGFVELDAEDVVVYSAYGARVRAIQPGYAKPRLAVGGNHFVLYNRGGNELRVESRTRNLYTHTFEENLLLCALSNNGSVAVVTESGRYAAQLQVFDRSFHRIYSWQMTAADGTPIAVDFSPDNRRFAAGTLAAQGGQLRCAVYCMDTSDTAQGPVYTATPGCMLLALDWQSDNRLVAVFDSYIAVLDPRTATETARYDFGGATLQSVAPGRRQTALLLNIRGGNSLVTLDADLTPMAEIPARQAFAISANDTEIYLLCSDAVECYGYDGVQKWVRGDLSARPLEVVQAAQPLLFYGTTAEQLTDPAKP